MLSHVFVGVNDFERAFDFYTALMSELRLKLRFRDDAKPWAGWQSPDAPRPLFLVGAPFDGQESTNGNGHMVALMAADRATVDRAHAAALANGGSCEGPPGLRPNGFYAAYFRDPDGNKMNSFCVPQQGG